MKLLALGAAVQANILERGVSNMLLLDVTPLSLGIETYGGAVAQSDPAQLNDFPQRSGDVHNGRGTTRRVSDIHVLQGERELAKDCRLPRAFQFESGRPRPPACRV